MNLYALAQVASVTNVHNALVETEKINAFHNSKSITRIAHCAAFLQNQLTIRQPVDCYGKSARKGIGAKAGARRVP